MVKLMSVLRKKEGMTRADFINYYENFHAPLAVKLLGMGHDYRRNYLLPDGSELGSKVEFDVITEVRFNDMTELNAMMQAFNDPQMRQILEEDEKKFLDPDRRAFLVEEYVSRGEATHRSAAV